MKRKWYDWITFGLTWIIRTYKLGKIVRNLWNEADIDKNGKITSQEFAKFLKRDPQYFRQVFGRLQEAFNYKLNNDVKKEQEK